MTSRPTGVDPFTCQALWTVPYLHHAVVDAIPASTLAPRSVAPDTGRAGRLYHVRQYRRATRYHGMGIDRQQVAGWNLRGLAVFLRNSLPRPRPARSERSSCRRCRLTLQIPSVLPREGLRRSILRTSPTGRMTRTCRPPCQPASRVPVPSAAVGRSDTKSRTNGNQE